MTRLVDLNPRYSATMDAWTPETGGTPNGLFQLIFLCPVCRDHEVSVLLGPLAGEGPRRWKASPMPPVSGWCSGLTVEPSIDNTHNSHKGHQCGFHGSITNGEIH